METARSRCILTGSGKKVGSTTLVNKKNTGKTPLTFKERKRLLVSTYATRLSRLEFAKLRTYIPVVTYHLKK